MADQRPLVTKDKDISVHKLDNFQIKFTPGAGQQSFAGRTLFFEVDEYGVSIPLIDNPDNANGKIISVTTGQLTALPAFTRFAVRDRTAGASEVLWSGRLERYS